MGLHHGSVRHSGNQSARRHITRDKPDRASVANDDDERSKEHDGRGKRLRSTGPTPTTALSRSAKHGLASLVLPSTGHQHRRIPFFLSSVSFTNNAYDDAWTHISATVQQTCAAVTPHLQQHDQQVVPRTSKLQSFSHNSRRKFIFPASSPLLCNPHGSRASNVRRKRAADGMPHCQHCMDYEF